jgi:hypothetical protein
VAGRGYRGADKVTVVNVLPPARVHLAFDLALACKAQREVSARPRPGSLIEATSLAAVAILSASFHVKWTILANGSIYTPERSGVTKPEDHDGNAG